MKISEIMSPINNGVVESVPLEDSINQISPVGSTPRKNARAEKAKKKISDITTDLKKITIQ